ncbi:MULTISPECIES: hypothetical protein [unclassified Streptomyces]|uniref:hypothetical protein n=1 Tax=unclassified Streptomyces TaxID=2593676 RepID=UPI0007DDD950|nr:hypothetical protein [Streptomyces sp. SAT1]ANH89901.1 hypothetical protein A8713_01085 [Streptomyces sp. SAT1]
MVWQTEEFEASHEGYVGAVLADGSEPKPVIIDIGSGTNMYQTSEWWAYSGKWGRPRAAAYRGACSCDWRGPDHPVDWDDIGDGGLEDLDVGAAHDDWSAHIDAVDRRAVPVPEEIAEALVRLEARLSRLVDQAPVAALRAVRQLEQLTRDIGHEAAYAAEADELSAETIGQGLGISAGAARSRLTGYRLRR